MKYRSIDDEEDFEQEKKIKEWADRNNINLDYKYTTKNNTAKNSFRDQSLDKKFSNDNDGCLLDILVGQDGNDLYKEAETEFDEILDAHLYFLNIDEETAVWVIKILKSFQQKNKMLLERFLTDSEWWKL